MLNTIDYYNTAEGSFVYFSTGTDINVEFSDDILHRTSYERESNDEYGTNMETYVLDGKIYTYDNRQKTIFVAYNDMDRTIGNLSGTK